MDNNNGLNYNDSFDGNGQVPNGYNQGQTQQQGYQPDAYLNQQQGYQGSGPLYQQQGYQGSGPLYQQQGYQGSGPLYQQQGYQGSGPLYQQQGYQGTGPLYQQQGYPSSGPVYQQPYYNGNIPPSDNKPKKHKGCLLSFLIIQALIILGLFIMAFGAIGSDDDASKKSSSNSKKKVTSSTTESKTESTTEKEKKTTTEATTETTTEADDSEDTYENNQYYEIVEEASYKDSIDDTIIIHKVLAKQNASVDSTVIAYDDNGSVIGKSTSDIELTEGEYNYFEYYFDANVDVSNASMEYTVNADEPSWSIGDRDAVEMVEYNVSGDNLYVTLKQTSDNLGAFSQFKILFYKNGEIVGSEDCYIDIYAENLSGKDTTDVAEIWVWGKDFDDIEYIYEP